MWSNSIRVRFGDSSDTAVKRTIVAITPRFAGQRNRVPPGGAVAEDQRQPQDEHEPRNCLPRLLPRTEASAAARFLRVLAQSVGPEVDEQPPRSPDHRARPGRSADRVAGLVPDDEQSHAGVRHDDSADRDLVPPVLAGDETAIAPPSPTTARRAAAPATDLRMATA